MSAHLVYNFKIINPAFALTDVADIKWINDGTATDLRMDLLAATFSGYETAVQEQMDTAWENLRYRSQENLTEGSAFRFYNSEILKYESLQTTSVTDGIVSVSGGLFYRDITAVRSNQLLFDSVKNKPSAFVLMTILVTADNKIVLGRRSYYGDWPNDTYECPGSFLKEKAVAAQSLTEIVKEKVCDDYNDGGDIVSVPLLICDMPRVMETMLLCVSKTSLTAVELQSDFYTDTLVLDNSQVGRDQLQAMDLDLFHPPSRVSLQAYFDNFELAQKCLETLGS
jgi:hypothetical protein